MHVGARENPPEVSEKGPGKRYGGFPKPPAPGGPAERKTAPGTHGDPGRFLLDKRLFRRRGAMGPAPSAWRLQAPFRAALNDEDTRCTPAKQRDALHMAMRVT